MRHGPTAQPFALASITKVLTALTALIAAEEGTIALDDVVTEAGATVADLLAHAGGLAPDGDNQLADVGTRRIYSNRGIEMVADHVAARSGLTFADYLTEAFLSPLGATATVLTGSPAHAAHSSVDDLVVVVDALLRGRLIAPETLAAMTTPHRPELAGVLPGFGRQDPNLWGLGVEIRGAKHPHWTSPTNSGSTWGHFGQTGTFLWHDPEVETTAIVLTDLDFGDWALQPWPALSTALLGAVDPTTASAEPFDRG